MSIHQCKRISLRVFQFIKLIDGCLSGGGGGKDRTVKNCIMSIHYEYYVSSSLSKNSFNKQKPLRNSLMHFKRKLALYTQILRQGIGELIVF